MFGGFGYACLASAYFTTAHIGNRVTPWVVLAACLESLSAAMVSFRNLNGHIRTILTPS
jgi:hypothetical protein